MFKPLAFSRAAKSLFRADPVAVCGQVYIQPPFAQAFDDGKEVGVQCRLATGDDQGVAARLFYFRNQPENFLGRELLNVLHGICRSIADIALEIASIGDGQHIKALFSPQVRRQLLMRVEACLCPGLP